MLQYNIHLRTVNDFRNYANMIVRFNIAGFVRVRKEEINMYDIHHLDQILQSAPVLHRRNSGMLTKYLSEITQ